MGTSKCGSVSMKYFKVLCSPVLWKLLRIWTLVTRSNIRFYLPFFKYTFCVGLCKQLIQNWYIYLMRLEEKHIFE